MTKTVTIQIGNSDNKLTQDRWSEFCNELDDVTNSEGIDVHFFGFSNPNNKWQNACCVCVVHDQQILNRLVENLKNLRGNFEQDSIAVSIGSTEFI